MKLLVLGGGNSPEREVSLRSAKSVADAAKNAGYDVKTADSKDGVSIFDNLDKDTVVLPILHGAGGEDGTLQAEMEKRGLSFLGASSISSKSCFDKWLTRQALEKNGIVTPKAVRVNKQTYASEKFAKQPHVLKVLHGGSSIGTVIVRDPIKTDEKQVERLFALENDAVLEELIKGVEITVPILDKTALMPIEIVPPPDGEFDYENKYNGKSQELCPPPSLSRDQIKQAQKIAQDVHEAMNCRHLSRVDIMLGSDDKFYVLEINTIPGLTDQSLYPKAAKLAGYDMPALVSKFVDLVKRDYSL